MSDDEEAKTPIDQALDLFVFLPIGFMFDFPRSIPRYIERGRRQFDAAIRMGHSKDQGGVAQSPAPFDRLAAQTRSTLRALGVVPPNGSAPSPGSASQTTRSPIAAAKLDPHWSGPSSGTTSDSSSVSASSAVSASGAEVPPRPDDPFIGSETLAIPDYDSLSASQVVPRLDSLAIEELELVRQYENAKRGRKTILSKIAQLQGS